MKKQKGGLFTPLNNRGTTIDNKPQLSLDLMFLHDSAFPTGSYAHSFGMETFIQREKILDKDDLRDFCKVYLKDNLGCSEAVFLKEAYHLVYNKLLNKESSLKNRTIELKKLIELENYCHVFKNTTELRKASTMMGRQFLKAILPLYKYEILVKWKQLLDSDKIHGDYIIVYSILAAYLGIDSTTAIMTYLYANISSLIYNAVRAIPLGQQAGISTIHSLLLDCYNVAELVMEKGIDDIYNCTPGLEMASMEHQFLYTRLFIS